MNLRSLFFLAAALLCTLLPAQSPRFSWGACAGTTDADEGVSIAVDDKGNTYVTGGFVMDSIRFGHVRLYDPLSSYRNMFLVKYDAGGQVRWAAMGDIRKQAYPEKVIADDKGNCFVAGFFVGEELRFNDSLALRGSRSGHTGFLVKFDSTGRALWANGAPGTTYYDMTMDRSGAIYLTGDHRYAYFLSKYDADGKPGWSKDGYAAGKNWGFGATTDQQGNVFVTGRFEAPEMRLGNFTLKNSTEDLAEVFFVKYDSAGNELLAKSLYGSGTDGCNSIGVDQGGNVYLCGYSSSDTLKADGLASIDTSDAGDRAKNFIVSFDAQGKARWLKRSYGLELSVSPKGTVYTTGSKKGRYIKDDRWSRYANDLYIGAHDAAGNLLWEKVYVDNDWAEGKGIAIDAKENIYVTGFFTAKQLDIDGIELKNQGAGDMFVIKTAK